MCKAGWRGFGLIKNDWKMNKKEKKIKILKKI